jgi:hypothetical protein
MAELSHFQRVNQGAKQNPEYVNLSHMMQLSNPTFSMLSVGPNEPSMLLALISVASAMKALWADWLVVAWPRTRAGISKGGSKSAAVLTALLLYAA